MTDDPRTIPAHIDPLSDLLIELRLRRRVRIDELARHYREHGVIDPAKEREVAMTTLAVMGCEKDFLG